MFVKSLPERMKAYESVETDRRLIYLLPVLARVDGHCFHKFCHKLKRPYDERLSQLMVATAKKVAEDTLAQAAYTQSDEITFAWSPGYDEMPFGSRVHKLISYYAALTSVIFNKLLPEYLPEKADQSPTFDCRVWNCPNLLEASNSIVWREIDATRNSIQMAGQAHFSHKQLHKKNSSEIQEMLFSQKDINWNDFPEFFKRGTYILRTKKIEPLTEEELVKIPTHISNPNPNKQRTEYIIKNLPPITKVVNRIDVLFHGKEPELKKEEP